MTDPTLWVYEKGKQTNDKIRQHETERARCGFSTYDWWNFSDYLSWVIIQGLEKFKTGHGYPAALDSMDEWVKILDNMISGFKAQQEISSMDSYNSTTMNYMEWYTPLKEKWEAGGTLFIRYYGSLWD